VLVVIPTDVHLRQLREIGAVLEIEPGKRERLFADVEPRFEVERSTTVEWDFHPEPDDVATLIGMGPSALHGSRLQRVAEDAATTITASVEVHMLAPRPGERTPSPR
jgi:23S rRNA (guanine745-N1)-methyltransferase